LKIPIEDDVLRIEYLEKSRAKIFYVSPSHQYPTGSVMPIRKRMQLLSWAEREKGYIIEDDYDSILRYEGYPVPALQGISTSGRVIYAGSFSKLLIPSLRISFLILPHELLKSFHMVRNRYSQSVSKTEQLALAEYMRDGSFERHLRRIRILYKKKNQLLVEAFKKYPTKYFDLVGKESGLHVVLSFAKEVSLPYMVERAKAEGIALEGVEEYQDNRILVFSYSGIKDEEMDAVVRKLVKCSEDAARKEVD
jgi:GntR family transcriptional regulator/MocR family aminotransferase